MKRLMTIITLSLAFASFAERDTAIYRGKLTSDLNANWKRVTNAAPPVAAGDLANKAYVDSHAGDVYTNAVRDIVRDTLATNGIRSVDGSARPLPKYLHALHFDDTYPEDAERYYQIVNYSNNGGCSVRRVGGIIERNLDWTFDTSPDFVIYISSSEGRFASVGVANVSTNLTEDMVTSGSPSGFYKCLPGHTVDGINEYGVFAEINVVVGDPHATGGWRNDGNIHPLGAVRWVLDHAKSAQSAAEHIAAKIKFPSGWTQNFHYMIADETSTYIVENGIARLVTDKVPAMTNFKLYPFSYGDGWERYIALTNGTNIKDIWYTNAYSTDTEWSSEFPSSEIEAEAKRLWNNGEGKESHRGEKRGMYYWWQTVHTSVYDITNRSFRIAVQEIDDWYTFALTRNVKSINGNTGYVEIGASDVGAVANNSDYANVKSKALSALQAESDPSVSAWAKASTKPSYTPAEVGAVANDATYAQVASNAGSALQWSDISPSVSQFSTAVLAVGLNIDTNSVAVLNEIASSFGGFPITGTATTIGGLLAALAAAVTWLRKRSVVTVELSDPNETMAQIKSRIDGLKNNHVLFDTSSINVENRMYLCGVNIDVVNGGVRIQDTKTGRIYIGPYVGTETILQVLSKAVDEYVPITVTAIRKDGNAVTGKTVYLYEGDDDTGELVKSVVYNGEPVTFKVGGGFRYFVKIDGIDGLFTPTTASGVANVAENVTLVYGDADHIFTYEDVKMALAALGTVEAAKEKLVGRVSIADTWTDLDSSGSGDATPSQDAAGHPIWDDPMVCTDVQMVEDADGNQHLAAIMMRQYATAKKIQFDPNNWDVATEEVAQDGITYYGSTTASPSSASNVTVLSLSPGDAIPYGSYNTVFRNTVNDPYKNVIIYGYNRYQYSAWRQYLNAPKTAGKGLWWTKQRVGQVSPNDGDYNTHPYQAGCSAALLAAIKPIKRTVAANTATDGGGTYQVCDLLWLPAHVEMFGKTDTTEGSMQQEYWRYVSGEPAANPKTGSWAPRKQYNVTSKSSAVTVWLRSAYASNSYYVYAVLTIGSINTNYFAYSARAGVPACAIY